MTGHVDLIALVVVAAAFAAGVLTHAAWPSLMAWIRRDDRRRPFRGTYVIDHDEPADVDPADFQPVAALVLLSALTVAQAKTESARLRGVDSDVDAR